MKAHTFNRKEKRAIRLYRALEAHKRDQELQDAIDRRHALNTPWTDAAGIEQASRYHKGQ